jgi:hypothetical protein
LRRLRLKQIEELRRRKRSLFTAASATAAAGESSSSASDGGATAAGDEAVHADHQPPAKRRQIVDVLEAGSDSDGSDVSGEELGLDWRAKGI